MIKSLISLAVLGTLVTPVVYATEAAKTETKEESNWSLTTNMGYVSDYRARGVSQTWRKEAIQGGFDLTHSSGFYLGGFGSNVTPNTYPKANVELDLYAGYNGTVAAVEGLGYTAGVIGYFYPNGSWKKYTLGGSAGNESGISQTPQGGRWDTYEANAGISYKWISAKGSVTLGDWYGAERKTGWTKSTRGTTYLELNAAIPTPLDGLTLIGHVGRLDVNGELNLDFTSGNFPGVAGGSGPSASPSGATKPDYTDYKVGLSYAFKVLNADGWNAGLYYIGNNNDNYWGSRGYGGTSFNGATIDGVNPESKNLNKDAAVFTLGRTF